MNHAYHFTIRSQKSICGRGVWALFVLFVATSGNWDPLERQVSRNDRVGPTIDQYKRESFNEVFLKRENAKVEVVWDDQFNVVSNTHSFFSVFICFFHF